MGKRCKLGTLPSPINSRAMDVSMFRFPKSQQTVSGESKILYHLSNIRYRDSYGGTSVCVWNIFSSDRRRNVHYFHVEL